MRRLYILTFALVLFLLGQNAYAWNYELPIENKVLDSVYNYQPYKVFDFFNGKYFDEFFSDGANNRVSGDGCFTTNTDKASFKLNGFDAFQVLKPVEMNDFYLGIGTSAINLRAGINKDGLHNYGSGSRFLAIANVKKGQIIVCQWGVADSRYPTNVVQPSAAISGADACEVTNISDEIHEKQIEIGTTKVWDYDPEFPGDEEHAKEIEIPGTADWYTYWRIESDGYLVIEMQRGIAIQGLQIWLDNTADEAVSAPNYSIYSVDGEARQVTLTPGTSTLGKETTAWYGIEDGDKDENDNIFALYLVDSDEIDHIDYKYDIDPETGDTINVTEIPVYKKILDPEAGTYYGQNKYDGTPITISSENDINGDGYVTIVAATTSELGNFSDTQTFKIAVGSIQLNAPTITLNGLEGEERTYSVAWNNNTLCKEDYTITVCTDESNEESYTNAEGFDWTVTANQSVKITVNVTGYEDGVLEEEVLNPGTFYYRKNTEAAAADKHDWDFVHLTPTQYQQITGTYSETYVYVTPNEEDNTKNDSTFYSRDEFYALVEQGTLSESDATPYNPIDCGWSYDASRQRATLNVIAPDTTYTESGEINEIIINGKDANGNGYGYVDDSYVQLFNNGLSVSCPANAKNASTIYIYNNNDLGVYFMSRPTLTFSRKAAQYGEYILIQQGAGGSNYTNWRSPLLVEVPESELCTVTLANGGIHVFNIDVYTTETLPEDGYVEPGEETSISTIAVAPKTRNYIYDLSGRRVLNAKKGIYIINGKKVLR